MKLKTILLTLLLISGCAQTPNENELTGPEISHIYTQTSAESGFAMNEFYPSRLVELQNHDYTQAVIVYVDKNQDPEAETAKEITLTDPTDLRKLADYFKSITQVGGQDTITPYKLLADFSITIQDKEPIPIRIYDEQFAAGHITLSYAADHSLSDLLAELSTEVKEVQIPSLTEPFVYQSTWADQQRIIPDEKVTAVYESNFIDDVWADRNTQSELLGISNYIHEDFDNWHEIQDTQSLVSGLIQRAEDYQCFETPNNVCIHESSHDLLYLPQGKPILREGFDYFDLVPYEAAEAAGRSLFGEDFELPSVPNGKLVGQNLESYDYLADQELFAHHSPYDGMFLTTSSMYPLNWQVNDDEFIVTLAECTVSYTMGNDPESPWPVPVVHGMNGWYQILDYDDPAYEAIDQQPEKFRQWEYTLTKTENGYKIERAHCLNREESIRSDEGEVFQEDELGNLRVNLPSEDAALFNEWFVAGKGTYYKQKTNLYENMATVYLNGFRKLAVVFSLEDGHVMTMQEVIEAMGVNMEHLMRSLRTVDAYRYYREDLTEWNFYVNSLPTTPLFVDSNGNPALCVNDEVIVFDWGEVQ